MINTSQERVNVDQDHEERIRNRIERSRDRMENIRDRIKIKGSKGRDQDLSSPASAGTASFARLEDFLGDLELHRLPLDLLGVLQDLLGELHLGAVHIHQVVVAIVLDLHLHNRLVLPGHRNVPGQ